MAADYPVDALTGDDAIESLATQHVADIGEAYALTARTAARVLDVNRVSIWLFSTDQRQLHRIYEYPEAGRRDFRLTIDLSERADYPRALRDNLLYQLDAAAPETSASDPLLRYMRDHDIAAMLDAAIRADGKLVGAICHERRTPRDWQPVDRRRALRFGRIASHFIAAERRRRSIALGIRSRLLVERSADAIALATPSGALEYLNPKAREVLGLAPDEPLFGLRVVDFLQPESRTQGTQRIYPAARDNGSWTGRVQLRTRQNLGLEATATLNVYRGDKGQVEHLSCVLRDVVDGPNVESRVAEMRQRYEQALAQAGECLLEIDATSLTLRSVSGGFERFLGYAAARVETLSLYDLCDNSSTSLRDFVRRTRTDGHLLCGETRVRHGEGHWVDVEMSMMRREAGGRRHASISVRLRDISERIQRRQDIERLAYYDPLTGLANSNLLRERAERMLGESLREGGDVGFLLLRLDRWQRIFDIQGYQAAESLIQQVGQRLTRAFEQRNVLVARLLGGVEFGVLYDARREQSQELATIAHGVFDAPFRADRESLHLNVRSANARAPLHAVNFKDLTKRAGIALRNAHLHNLSHCEYDPTQSTRLHDERLIEEDLRKAIGTSQLRLRYQPIRSVLPSKQWAGAEVLVRWQHPQLGLLAPQDFVPLAEESNLILQLDRHVLGHAASRAACWQGDLAKVVISVNISAVTLLNGDLPAMLTSVLEESGLPPWRLCLELTETAIMHDRARAAETLTEAKALGVHIALDDFGTGYSSLAYLKDLPVDTLKIDQDFVHGIGADSRDENTIETVIRLGHDLGLFVLAEGVETRAQLQWLAARDIDYVQGYYVGLPVNERSLIDGRRHAWRRE